MRHGPATFMMARQPQEAGPHSVHLLVRVCTIGSSAFVQLVAISVILLRQMIAIIIVVSNITNIHLVFMARFLMSPALHRPS